MGMADLLKQSELSTENKEYLDIILQSGNNLSHIISEILDFSTIDSNKIELIPFNLMELMDNINIEFQPKAQQKALNLKINYDNNFNYLFIGDPIRIRQLIVNIIDNSIKFTHQGQILVTISPANRIPKMNTNSEHEYSVLISIEDTGIGIAKKDQERVFDAFTQLDQSNTRQYGGTGLGLSISKKMIELMHGHITLDSLLDKGTTINVYLLLALQETKSSNE